MTSQSAAESIPPLPDEGAPRGASPHAVPDDGRSRVAVDAPAARLAPLRAVPGGAPRRRRAGVGGQDPAPLSPTPPALPDPRPLVTNLARCVIEILAGARDIEQIARWVSDEVYRHLLKRVVLATRARSVRGTSAARPTFSVGAVRITEPDDGVVEAVVVMHGRARSRAVAIRLETINSRWRATAIHVL